MSQVEALVARLLTVRRAGHDFGLEVQAAARFSQALRDGAELHVALTQLPRARGLSKMIEVAKPHDGIAVTDRLLSAFVEAAAHRRLLRSRVAYPSIVLIAVMMAGLIIQIVAIPAMRTATADIATTLNEHSPSIAFVLAVAVFLALLGSVLLEIPFSPLSWVLRRVQRVVMLEAVSALSDQQVPLNRAFEAAAELTHDGELRRAGIEVAAALAAGRAPRANALLDSTAGRLVFAAGSRGAAGPVTKTLCRHASLTTKRTVDVSGQAVQMVALLLAAVALLSVAATWYATYSAALASGA